MSKTVSLDRRLALPPRYVLLGTPFECGIGASVHEDWPPLPCVLILVPPPVSSVVQRTCGLSLVCSLLALCVFVSRLLLSSRVAVWLP